MSFLSKNDLYFSKVRKQESEAIFQFSPVDLVLPVN